MTLLQALSVSWVAGRPAGSCLLGKQSRASMLPMLVEIAYEMSNQMHQVMAVSVIAVNIIIVIVEWSTGCYQWHTRHAACWPPSVSGNHTTYSHFIELFILHCFAADLIFNVFPPSFSQWQLDRRTLSRSTRCFAHLAFIYALTCEHRCYHIFVSIKRWPSAIPIHPHYSSISVLFLQYCEELFSASACALFSLFSLFTLF